MHAFICYHSLRSGWKLVYGSWNLTHYTKFENYELLAPWILSTWGHGARVRAPCGFQGPREHTVHYFLFIRFKSTNKLILFDFKGNYYLLCYLYVAKKRGVIPSLVETLTIVLCTLTVLFHSRYSYVLCLCGWCGVLTRDACCFSVICFQSFGFLKYFH